MVDFDKAVNNAVSSVFGRPVTYRPLVSQPAAAAFSAVGIFDEQHQLVLEDIPQSEQNAPGHSTTAPVLTVKLVQFVNRPRKNDEVVIGAKTYLVWDVQPDGEGMADLVLRKKL